jgi:hypothetical protein
MKTCPRCKVELPLSCYTVSVSRPNGNSYCRPCQSEYSKAHYRRNVKIHNHRRGVNQTRYKIRNRKLVKEYFASHACVDCGEADVRVLEFDHERGKKEFDISTAIQGGWAWERIAREMTKCEVRCANCHRRRTVEVLRRPRCGT